MNLHDRDITRAAKQEGLRQGLSQGLAQGLAQGASKAKIEAAKNLLQMKLLSTEQIAQAAGLSQQQVLELQKEIRQ